MGVANRKSMVIPCVVNRLSYMFALRNIWFGVNSSIRMRSTERPPHANDNRPNTPYKIPMSL